MKIAHISDIHTAEPHFLPDLLERVIKEINKIEPEIVVVTGDLTDNGYPFEFKRAKSYIERIECDKKVVIPGNHDARNVGYLGFEEIFGHRSMIEKYRGITIVGLDSTQPDLDDGHVGREKYGWIEKCLDTNDFKVVALHHHLISVPKTGRERQIPMDAGDVLELLLRCGVDLVLSGHKHVPWVWNLNGMVIANAGTACTNRVKWNIPQSFNLIEIDEEDRGTIKIYRIYSRGGKELVLEKRWDKERNERFGAYSHL
jgi:Icc protein